MSDLPKFLDFFQTLTEDSALPLGITFPRMYDCRRSALDSLCGGTIGGFPPIRSQEMETQRENKRIN